jgi:flagellar motor switch protein FliM
LGVEFQFEQRQHPSRVQHLLSGEEKTLGLSFEVTMKDCRGLLSIAVPAVVSNALLRKLSSARPRSQAQLGAADSGEQLRRRLLGCPFRLDMDLALSVNSAAELASLVPGQVLALKKRADGIAELVSRGRPVFEARIARVGHLRAAQIIGSVKEQFPWRDHNGKSH